ncbi:hypothetical protein GQ53DRAFT_804955 [Thozetella sp. PMI_491]|nr:hypothetical protein GQ53DRAFT_804955 [Thozetella sp. PMI_491]
MASAAPITKCPPEILDGIASCLDSRDIKLLRLSCRYVDACVLRAFAQVPFHDVHVMRCRPSLQALVDLSSTRLGFYVKRLVVSNEVLHDYNHRAAWCSYQRNLKRDIKRDNLYRDFINLSEEQKAIMATGEDRKMLVKALSNLDLDVVGMRDFQPNPVFTSWNRPPRLWSIGSRDIYLKAGMKLDDMRPLTHLDPTNKKFSREDGSCFLMLLQALGTAKARPKRFEVYFDGACAFPDYAMDIPVHMEPCVVPMISGLEDVHLEVNGDYLRDRMESPTTPTLRLRRFLSHTSSVRSLSISFRELTEWQSGFIAWLGGQPSQELPEAGLSGPPPVSLTQLQCLHLSGVTTSTEAVLHVIQKVSRTLQSLALTDLNLRGKLHSADGDGGSASEPCRQLMASLLPLSGRWYEIRLSRLSNHATSWNRGPRTTTFKVTRDGATGRFRTFSYKGFEARVNLGIPNWPGSGRWQIHIKFSEFMERRKFPGWRSLTHHPDFSLKDEFFLV